MKVWTYVFAFLFTLLLVSCSISTKSRREADLKAAQSSGYLDGFVKGCTFAANGITAHLGIGINPEALAQICKENAAK